MKRLISNALALVFAAVALNGLAAGLTAPLEEAGLERLSRGSFAETWAHPDVDFSRYDKLLVVDGSFEYRKVGPARRLRASNLKEFPISAADRARFESEAARAFDAELARSNSLALADAPGPNTLVLRGHVVDIVSSAPPPRVGPGEVYGNSVGEATIVLELIDAESGETVAFAAERRKIRSVGGNNVDHMFDVNKGGAWREVRRWAGNAGARLINELEAGNRG